MATSYTSRKIDFNNAEQFKESFYEPEPSTVGYVFIGNHIAYANESSPPNIEDTVFDEKSVWDNMFAAKKLSGNDLELVVPRVDWTGNTKYRQFNDKVQVSELVSSNVSQNLKPMYVMNSERNVYKCLCNNVSANSVVEPTGKSVSSNGIITTADSYVWKYMFNVRESNKFLTSEWIPVPTSTAQLDYDMSDSNVVDGEVTKVVTVNAGNNYFHSNVVVSSFTSGCTVLTVLSSDDPRDLNTAITSSQSMSISGLGISSGSYITSVDTFNRLLTISLPTTTSGGGSGNSYPITTRIEITGDGTGAEASVQLSPQNTISKIVVTGPPYGSGYTEADVNIYGSGTGAQARVVLPPKFGHGYNPAKELGCSSVMIVSRIGEIDTTEGGIISSNTSIRQYGFLRDPYKYGETRKVAAANANNIISQTTNVTLVAGGSPFDNNEFVYQGSISNPTFSGYVNSVVDNSLKLTRTTGELAIGVVMKGQNTNPVGKSVVSLQNPEFEPYTGDILYVKNVEKIQRTEGQAELLRFVISF